ncbi:hypothetical protein, partial [Ureaplasma diversum]|uniref:hypothetical protein n=1 Tax=Ureaplasma diversum TaxID=42094 RepID=UPI000571706A
QSGGTQSTNPGSGSTTSPSKQGSKNNTTNPSAGSTNTNSETSPKDGAGSSSTGKDSTKQEDKKMQGDQPDANGGTAEKPKDDVGTEAPDKPKVGSGDGNTGTGKNEQPKEGSGSDDNKKPDENAGSGESNKQQSGSDSENGKKADSDTKQPTPDSKESEMKQKPGETDTETPSPNNGEAGNDTTPKNQEQPDKKETDQDTLDKKKQDAKTKVSSSVYLLEDDKKALIKKIDDINSNDQVAKIEEIIKEYTEKENERKGKLTPTSASIRLDGPNKDWNYLNFQFKTSKETFEKIKTKKFKMLLDIVGFNKGLYEEEDDSASLSASDKGPFIIGKELSDGSMLVVIETYKYYNESTGAPEGKYKLINLWYMEDNKKIELLNQASKEIEIKYKKAAA